MGRMGRRAMRPVPLCMTPCLLGTEEPVSRKRPGFPSASTCARTASQSEGTSCHSSTKRGGAPSSTESGLICARFRLLKLPCGSPTIKQLSDWLSAAHVFPHHFAPSTLTAPKASRNRLILLSISRGLYPFGVKVIVRSCSGNSGIFRNYNPVFSEISTRSFQEFCSGVFGHFGHFGSELGFGLGFASAAGRAG